MRLSLPPSPPSSSLGVVSEIGVFQRMARRCCTKTPGTSQASAGPGAFFLIGHDFSVALSGETGPAGTQLAPGVPSALLFARPSAYSFRKQRRASGSGTQTAYFATCARRPSVLLDQAKSAGRRPVPGVRFEPRGTTLLEWPGVTRYGLPPGVAPGRIALQGLLSADTEAPLQGFKSRRGRRRASSPSGALFFQGLSGFGRGSSTLECRVAEGDSRPV